MMVCRDVCKIYMAPEELCLNVKKCVMSLEAQATPFCNSQHSPAHPCQAHPIPTSPITALPIPAQPCPSQLSPGQLIPAHHNPAQSSLAKPNTYIALALALAHSHTPWPCHEPKP